MQHLQMKDKLYKIDLESMGYSFDGETWELLDKAFPTLNESHYDTKTMRGGVIIEGITAEMFIDALRMLEGKFKVEVIDDTIYLVEV